MNSLAKQADQEMNELLSASNQLIQRHRFGKEVSLRIVTTCLRQTPQYGFGLHSFGDDSK